MTFTRGTFSGGVVARADDLTRAPAVGRVAIIYLAALPVGQLAGFSVLGADAVVSDLLLLALLLTGMLEILRSVLTSAGEPLPRLDRPTAAGFVLLALFGVWVGASGLWGFHPAYATAKSVGMVALAAGAYLVAVAGVRPRVLVDAWVVGALGALVTTALYAALGQGREVLSGGGSVFGLPLPRLRGPFPHPGAFGEYLFVTGALLWARWPDLRAARRWLWTLVAAVVAVAFVWTFSTAWLAAGVALAGLGLSRRWGGSALRRTGLCFAGLVMAAGTWLGVVRSVAVDLGVFQLATGGIRPSIWSDAFAAFAGAPLLGVGAAPYLAETAHPAVPGATALWDAHSAYLSVLAQFGLVGFFFFVGGIGAVAAGVAGVHRALLAAGPGPGMRLPEAEAAAVPAGKAETLPDVDRAADDAEDRLTLSRLPFALLLIWAGLIVHWTTIAAEDFRHPWALLGLAGAVVAWSRRDRTG